LFPYFQELFLDNQKTQNHLNLTVISSSSDNLDKRSNSNQSGLRVFLGEFDKEKLSFTLHLSCARHCSIKISKEDELACSVLIFGILPVQKGVNIVKKQRKMQLSVDQSLNCVRVSTHFL